MKLERIASHTEGFFGRGEDLRGLYGGKAINEVYVRMSVSVKERIHKVGGIRGFKWFLSNTFIDTSLKPTIHLSLFEVIKLIILKHQWSIMKAESQEKEKENK